MLTLTKHVHVVWLWKEIRFSYLLGDLMTHGSGGKNWLSFFLFIVFLSETWNTIGAYQFVTYYLNTLYLSMLTFYPLLRFTSRASDSLKSRFNLASKEPQKRNSILGTLIGWFYSQDVVYVLKNKQPILVPLGSKGGRVTTFFPCIN